MDSSGQKTRRGLVSWQYSRIQAFNTRPFDGMRGRLESRAMVLVSQLFHTSHCCDPCWLS